MFLQPFRLVDSSVEAFPSFFCKYAAWHHVYDRRQPLVCSLLDNTPLQGGRRFISVDVKVQHLRLNETTCISGWHCDTIADPDALHHLFVIGDNRTEFNIDGKVVPIPHDHFVSFGSDVEHRGPETTVEETRLLFRVTESNIVRGNSKFHKQYPHRFPI